MLQLLGLKLGDGRGEVRIVVAQRLQLLGIMLVDLGLDGGGAGHGGLWSHQRGGRPKRMAGDLPERPEQGRTRSEEHTSELQSLMRISSAVFCLKKKKHKLNQL